MSFRRMRGVEQIPWFYDALMALAEAAGLRRWREALIAGVRGRVLEVGCGTGRNLPRYPSGARRVGLDPELPALRRARRRAPGVPLVCARAEALPFAGAVFDTVVSALVFCSVDDPHRGLLEIRRVLRPDGRLRMFEHVRARGRLAARWQDCLQPVWTRVSGGCRPNRDTEAAVLRAGFEIEPHTRREERTLRLFSARP